MPDTLDRPVRPRRADTKLLSLDWMEERRSSEPDSDEKHRMVYKGRSEKRSQQNEERGTKEEEVAARTPKRPTKAIPKNNETKAKQNIIKK